MKVAVEGCAHGELETIYNTIKSLEEKEKIKIDLLICCGDFQSTRNEPDLHCMAIPPKYYHMRSFYKYYIGELIAPILTIFIGGNHESSNYLQELPYGGWVAPNIYYMGYAGVVDIAGVRIGGISGIYKAHDFNKGRFETPPYSNDAKRSVYHIRNVDIFRLKQLSKTVKVFLSHDWPSGVWAYGNHRQLIKFKPHFESDIANGCLGSKPCQDLLEELQPEYWFAAHLHCKFAALVPHGDGGKTTKFLALDKCLPRRRFLQVIDIPHDDARQIQLNYDLEWLTILRMTNHLLSIKNVTNYMPGPNGSERWDFTPTEEELSTTLAKFEEDLVIPDNFQKTSVGYDPSNTEKGSISQPFPVANPQTINFCQKLGIDDPLDLLLDLNASFQEKIKEKDETEHEFTTFINETEVNKMTSLILPAPLYDSAELKNDDNVIDSKNECKMLEVKEQNVNHEVVESGEVTVPVKKFKRRNAEMYEGDD